LIEQIPSYKMLFFSTVTTTSYAFQPAMNKSLHAAQKPAAVKEITVTVAAAETHHPPPHCAHIHCLLFRKVQQVLVNVNGGHLFRMKELNATPLLHPHFHVRNLLVR